VNKIAESKQREDRLAAAVERMSHVYHFDFLWKLFVGTNNPRVNLLSNVRQRLLISTLLGSLSGLGFEIYLRVATAAHWTLTKALASPTGSRTAFSALLSVTLQKPATTSTLAASAQWRPQRPTWLRRCSSPHSRRPLWRRLRRYRKVWRK
jgi:hypothetical protein